MPEPSDPTRASDPPRTPAEGDTLDAPPAPEPATAPNQTVSDGGHPHTGTFPRRDGGTAGAAEPPGFVFLRELGSGGMGVVHEARQPKLNRRVAVKVLRAQGDPRDLVRFLAEAEAVAAIKHPNVVQVFEIGQTAAGPYMALELLTGGTLADRLRDGERLDPREAAVLVAKLAGAIQAAHELGIIHRDLKPGNVLFDERGEPKVTDFGLAKKAGGADLTRTQAVMGTPAYMAPEQARGEARFVGPAADVWALGAILYECLTGKRAFDADDTWAVLRKVTDEAPPAPRAHVPGLPRDLELIALKCLEKSPADRYPTAAALAADLENYLTGRPVSVRPAGPAERLAKWVRRNPVPAGAAVAVALALVIGSGVSLAFGLQAQRRGAELARANGDLHNTLGDLTQSRDALSKKTDDLTESQKSLKQSIQIAKEALAMAEGSSYLSDIALAHQLWKANDLAGMRAALARCLPRSRKWEWHYLNGLSHPERAQHVTDSLPQALAYSPDGKYLAWVTLSGTLTVTDLATGRPLHTVPGGAGFQREQCLAFHPKGGALAYLANNRVRVLDLATGKWHEPNAPDGEGQPGTAVAVGYTPGGQLLAAATFVKQGRTFAVYDLTAGKRISAPAGYAYPEGGVDHITCAGFSPDGKYLAVSAVDSGIVVRARDDPPKAPATFQPRVFVWEVGSGKLVAQPATGGSLFGGFAFDAESRTIALGRGAEVTEYALAPKQFSRQLPGHAGSVQAVAFDGNGRIWSGGEDKLILAHDRKTGAERFTVRGCSHGVVRLVVSPDGKEVAAAVGNLLGTGGAVYRFDAAALAADVWRAPVTRERLSLVAALSPDGSRFAAFDFAPFDDRPEGRSLVVRDIAGGKERAVEPARHWARGAFAPDGRLFVFEREKLLDKQEQLREIGADGKPGRALVPPGDAAKALHRQSVAACTPDGRTLALVTGETLEPRKLVARLDTWDASSYKTRASGTTDLSDVLPPDARFANLMPLSAAADREGKRLAATFVVMWEPTGGRRLESRGAAVVWDLATGKEILRKVVAVPLRAAAFDDSGRLAVAGGSPASGMIFGWDLGTGEQFLSLRGHTRPVLSLAFGPDGRLFTGGGDRVLKVWDLASKREVLSLDGFARDVVHLAFTTDGKNLVAATGMDLLSAMSAEGTPTDWPPAEVRVFRGPK